jgi:hypothetical protein
MHRKDLAHIVFGSPVLIILAFYFCRQVRMRWVDIPLRFVAGCAVFLAMLNPLVTLAAGSRTVTRRGVVYSYAPNPVLEFLNSHVAPGEPVFVYPYSPMYYFLSAAKNPTRYSILMYRMNTDAQFRDAVRSLDETKVRYAIWDRSFPTRIQTSFPAYRPPAWGRLIVERYLEEHYRVVGGADEGYQFLVRKNGGLETDRLAARSEETQ